MIDPMANPDDGILLIDKVEDETSFQVVNRIKKILGIKKVGHAGTLDPFATGLLIILLGQGTKLSPYLMAGEKTYRATLRLGVETDTQDLTGKILKTRSVPELDRAFIEEMAGEFIGEIEQTPPSFSALKVKGKRAYDLARKGLDVALQKRKVRVRQLEIISMNLPDVTFEVACSKGTYIRTLGNDLGRRLGPGGHLVALRRLSSFPFSVEESLALKASDPKSAKEGYRSNMIPLRNALRQLKEIEIGKEMAQKIRNGYQPKTDELIGHSELAKWEGGPIKAISGGDLIALVEISNSNAHKGDLSRIERVFT